MSLAMPSVSIGRERVIVLDTETTGLLPYDRIITLAAMCIEGDRVLTRSVYLIFDPRKDSHPRAEEVHGWDNWMTRFQDMFEDHASDLRAWLGWADKLVMHNADFDMRYLQRELRKAGQSLLDQPTYCTLEAARSNWGGQKCGLDDCSERIGITRRPFRHCALQDTFLTTALYLHLRGVPFRVPDPTRWPGPTNLRDYDPRPGGDLPRRIAKRPRSMVSA